MAKIQTIEQGKIRYAQRSGDRTDRILLWLERRANRIYWWLIGRRLGRLTHQWIAEGPFEVQEGDEIFCSHYEPVRRPLPVGSKYYVKSDGIVVSYCCAWCESR